MTFHGYQEFILTRDLVQVLPEDKPLRRKQELLAPLFEPSSLAARTVLDLGANAGFFSFWALQKGADRVVAVDVDEGYLNMMNQARARFSFENLEIVQANVENWETPADVVIALALIHWIYACTALFGSLDDAVGRLASLTDYMLMVEWIDPADPAIECFRHTDWNPDRTSGAYTLDAFHEALDKHFARYEPLGEISETRALYVAYQSPHSIDLSGPLPFLYPKETVFHSKRLTDWGDVEYWSRLYDLGDVICKQTSLDLAAREAHFLNQLSSDYFPNVVDTGQEDRYSWVMLEKVVGQPLCSMNARFRNDPLDFYGFIEHTLQILNEVHFKGIQHRDIRPDNILIRCGKPVLIDFGWAVSADVPYITPPLLGGDERPPDGTHCDVYSLGQVLKQVNRGRFPEFDPVIDLMTAAHPALRVTDIGVLRALFRSVMTQGVNGARPSQ